MISVHQFNVAPSMPEAGLTRQIISEGFHRFISLI
jgi:hypothetical protein